MKLNYFAIGYSGFKNAIEYQGINRKMILATAIDGVGAVTSAFVGGYSSFL
jgi:hypothetical protein